VQGRHAGHPRQHGSDADAGRAVLLAAHPIYIVSRKGGESMKKEINPSVIAVVLVCVLVIAGVFLSRAVTEKPSYPGRNAGHPTGEQAGGEVKQLRPEQVHTASEAAKQGFSGATPGGMVPDALKR